MNNTISILINPNLNRPANIREITRSIGRATTIAEEDKIYFCGWRNNGNTGTVSDKNYQKTRKIFGKALADVLRNRNISSRWTNLENEENLADIDRYLHIIDR